MSYREAIRERKTRAERKAAKVEALRADVEAYPESTQRERAERLGVDAGYVNRLLTGSGDAQVPVNKNTQKQKAQAAGISEWTQHRRDRIAAAGPALAQAVESGR